jgi:hypothetical protein
MDEKIILEGFLKQFIYTEQEIAASLSLLERFQKCKAPYNEFMRYYNSYKDLHVINYSELYNKIESLARESDMRPFELQLLFIQMLAAHSEHFYKAKGYSHELWIDCLTDLVWKMRECKRVNGFYGSRTFTWFERWLYATRITLGRLQFEIIESHSNYKSEQFDVKIGDKLINVHIPEDSTKAFSDENCKKAFAMAREFFRGDFEEKIIFRCSSWLLFPKHNEILPESSNIRMFLNSFEIDKASIAFKNSDLWRIFYTDKSVDLLHEYPEDSSLQRAYKKFLSLGESAGSATGYKY